VEQKFQGTNGQGNKWSAAGRSAWFIRSRKRKFPGWTVQERIVLRMNVPAFQGIKLWLHNFRREAPEIFGVQGLQICVVLVPLVPPRRRHLCRNVPVLTKKNSPKYMEIISSSRVWDSISRAQMQMWRHFFLRALSRSFGFLTCSSRIFFDFASCSRPVDTSFSGRACPLCRQRHLSIFLGYRSRTLTRSLT